MAERKAASNQALFADLTAMVRQDWSTANSKSTKLTVSELTVMYRGRMNEPTLSTSTVARAFEHCKIDVTPVPKRSVTVHECIEMNKKFLGLCNDQQKLGKTYNSLLARIVELETKVQAIEESQPLVADS